MDLDRFSKMRENLVDAGDGNYISRHDPHLWQKMLRKNPNDAKAMYHAALDLEEEARRDLEKYRETKISYFFRLYRKKTGECLRLLKSSWNRGYLFAGGQLLRISGDARRQASAGKTGPWSKQALLGLFLLLCFLSGAAASYLFLSRNDHVVKKIILEHRTYMLPYQVLDGQPGYIPAMDYESRSIPLEGGAPREKIVNNLVAAVKTMYEKDPERPKKVTAILIGRRGRQEVGMAVWAGGNSNILVYVYTAGEAPAPPAAAPGDPDYQAWETSTVIRSAIYRYAFRNGRLPEKLSDLTGPFPDNYLTSLPRDPFRMINSVFPSYNGTGGWVYSPGPAGTPGPVGEAVRRSLKLNFPAAGEIPFDPLCIFIDKTNNRLLVFSGSGIIRSYPVALGKEDATPEGELYISRKMVNPGDSPAARPYGTRVMELSDPRFAIHGTDSPGSVGKNVTLGCIRLNKDDMEDLYAITPLYTPVTISRAPPVTAESQAAGPDPAVREAYLKDGSPGEIVGTASNNWRG